MNCTNVAVGRHEEIKVRIIVVNIVFYSQQSMFTSRQLPK